MDVVLEDNMEIDLSAILRGDVNASYEADTHDVAPVASEIEGGPSTLISTP